MAMAIIHTAFFITHKLNVLNIKDKKHKTMKQTVQSNKMQFKIETRRGRESIYFLKLSTLACL